MLSLFLFLRVSYLLVVFVLRLSHFDLLLHFVFFDFLFVLGAH